MRRRCSYDVERCDILAATMNEELPAIIKETYSVAEQAEADFGHLNAEQLNWKPSADQWSVAQCFDHLIMTNSGYFPLVEEITAGGYRPSLKERLPLLPRFFGSVVLNAVQPEAKRKFKAVADFQPASSAIGGDIISKFKAHQEDVVNHMRLTEGLDLRKVIITSPVASFMTYSLLDAYKILVAHERRHMAQAKRVTQSQGFPNKS